MELRKYQADCVAAIYDHLRTRDDNPLAVIPTAGGKTPILATICRDAVVNWEGRVIVLAHVKELLQQALDKLRRVHPEMSLRCGAYSAGLGRRDTDHSVIVAGIQSVYTKACELGKFDLAIIDEAHLIPPEGEGMYQTFLSDARTINPNLRIIGLTATPYRLKSGMICSPTSILNAVCYEIGVRELIEQGYLCPLRSKAGKDKADLDSVHTRGGEFIAGELEKAMDRDELVESACREIVSETVTRRSVLVFATGVNHAKHIAEALIDLSGADVRCVFGETAPAVRTRITEDFVAGKFKFLVNVGVLTTGFDAPGVDCVALLRPTMSPGLYYQMVGRGFRLAPTKSDCLILDFGNNIVRHGPVDAVNVRATSQKDKKGEPASKECPACREVIPLAVRMCPNCQFQWPEPEPPKPNHDATATTIGILSGQVSVDSREVTGVSYTEHEKLNDPSAPTTMRVRYFLGLSDNVSEWVCFNHQGFARAKAESWWRKRSNYPVPSTVEQAIDLAREGALCETRSVTVREEAGDKFPRIIGYDLGEKPEYTEPELTEPSSVMEDIPF